MPDWEERKYDWSQFHGASDRAYRSALAEGNPASLMPHNLLRGGDKEIAFMLNIAKSHFHTTPVIGRALDIGCGAGYMSGCLAAAGFSVHGFDISEDAVALARLNCPGGDFAAGDAARPGDFVTDHTYDFILAREVHPFSRIDDYPLQARIVRRYLDLLRPRGLMVIGHARRGGGMHFPSVDFVRLAADLESAEFRTSGPYCFFLFKHLGISPRFFHLGLTGLISSAGRALQAISGLRLIEFFVILKE